jgi:hypothetical protein
VHGRLLFDEVFAPLESSLLSSESGLERTVRRQDLGVSSRPDKQGKTVAHDIELLELGCLHSSLTVPQADLESRRMRLDFMLPLHERNNGRDDE